MPDFWQEDNLIKRIDFEIRWYQLEKIQIIASEGDMSRQALETWANLVREMVDSIPHEDSAFIIIDLSNPKQGFTPYSGHVTRELLNYLVETRKGTSYIALVLANNLINQIIALFMQQILSRTQYPRNSFTTAQAALKWMREQIEKDEQSKRTSP